MPARRFRPKRTHIAPLNQKSTREVPMIELTRRSALAGAAMTTMAAAGGLAPEWARAAAAQAPDFYRYKVGSIEITVITDGANRLPVTDEFVLNAKKEEVNAALAEAFMEPGV